MGSEDAVGSPVDPRLGLLLGGRYRLVAPCGSGSMGVVYEGVHEGLGRRVAIKCLHPHLETSADFLTRFMSEARLASRLAHPNIVRIFDFGTEPSGDGALAYLVMEFCSGTTLGDLLQQEARFSLARIGSIMNQVLSALAESHDHGIVHRDVKPDNVILEQGARGIEVAKLVDFGIAEASVAGRRAASAIAGTPAYLSPEVIRGEAVDHQADLYAAGSMLFELVTGRALFDGDTVADILDQQLHAPRPDPRAVAPERTIPEDLAAVCLRAVALDPRTRFEDADALADAAASALSAPPSRPPMKPTPAPPSDPRPRVPLESGPDMVRPPVDVGRYSISGSDRVSGEHLTTSRTPTFWELQELEQEAAVAMTKRRWKEAAEKLRKGLDAATALVEGGEPELGAAAVTAFGRRMGEALRKDDRSAEAFEILRKALAHAPDGELSRALLLEELGLNASLMGRPRDALGAWLDAAEVARACGNAAVEQRLIRRLAGDRRR